MGGCLGSMTGRESRNGQRPGGSGNFDLAQSLRLLRAFIVIGDERQRIELLDYAERLAAGEDWDEISLRRAAAD